MPKRQEIATPAYRQIAIDIAKNIANGKYGKGQKLFGRSVLASQYRVSPETIRKAVFLLKDVGILETEKGSGIEVVSVDKAVEFIAMHCEVDSIASLKKEASGWIRAQTEQSEQMLQKIQRALSTVERLHTVSPLNPYRIEISADCKVIGKTVGETQFWLHTGGTVVAIQRGESLIVSPGPYATFCEGDIFFVVGTEEAYAATAGMLFD